VQFLRTQCKMRNDPSLNYDSMSASDTVRFQAAKRTGVNTRSMRTESFRNKASDLDQIYPDQTSIIRCQIHRAIHSLVDCRTFRSRSVFERKK
jgi:hypothetical protein